MKFNRYVTDKNNDYNISNYIGGGMHDASNGCLCIFVIFVILIYVLTDSGMISKEMFSVYNKTVDPKFVNNPNIVFDQKSKLKKKIYDSNLNFSNNCDDECMLIKNNIDKTNAPSEVNKAELSLHNWNYEGFENYNSRNAYQYDDDSSLYDYTCSRPQFIENKLNDTMLGKVWAFNQNSCNSLDLNQNKWNLNEGFVGDKKINDSRVLPFRSLPEFKIVESFGNFENQSLLTYAAGKCSDREDITGFDQTTKCCHRDNEKASMFQGLDENNLSNSLKLIDYASGDVHQSNLNDPRYDNIQEIPSLSSESCPYP